MVLEKITAYLNWFSNYVEKFLYFSSQQDLENILLKKEHCLRVYNYAKCLAKEENFSLEDRFCVELAGLFHDIGRFEQYRTYKTFKDKESEDHGNLGVKVLKKEGVFASLPEEMRKKILTAILLHNKLRVPKELLKHKHNKKIVLAVRDADKLDIFEVLIKYFTNGKKNDVVTLGLLDVPEAISPEILESIYQEKLANYNSMRYLNDFKLLLLSWIYDFNFVYSCKVFRQRGYLDTLINLLPPLKEVKELKKRLENKLLERIRQ